MLSSEEYLKYKDMIYKIANRYKNNKYFLDLDDLVQIGTFGLIYATEHYQTNKGYSINTYYYSCIDWSIKSELKTLSAAKRYTDNIISLDTPVTEDLYLSDMIQDSKINIEAYVLDILEVNNIVKEIHKQLDGINKSILIDKLLNELDNLTISNKYNIDTNRVRQIYIKARRQLISKSYYIRQKYKEYLDNTHKTNNTEILAIRNLI